MVLHIALTLAILIDIARKVFKVKRLPKGMKRYSKNLVNNADKIYWVFTLVAVVIYVASIIRDFSSDTISTAQIMASIMIYYGTYILFVDGVYYNGQYVYVNNYLIEYATCDHIYRYVYKNSYEFEVEFYSKKYKMNSKTHFRIPNDPSAFPLLMAIPFEEIDMNDN